jgi:hypothetical protein
VYAYSVYGSGRHGVAVVEVAVIKCGETRAIGSANDSDRAEGLWVDGRGELRADDGGDGDGVVVASPLVVAANFPHSKKGTGLGGRARESAMLRARDGRAGE